MDREFESYDDLFIDKETVNKLNERNSDYYDEEESDLDKFSTEQNKNLLKSEKSIENHNNEESYEEKYEQNHIITTNNDDFSFEDDNDDESFAEAAEESPNSDNEESSSDDTDFDSGGDDMDFDGGDSDFGGSDGDSMDTTGDESGNDGDNGIDVIDNNKGSSLNPFTQINQKRWTIDTLNELSKTIQNAIDLYNPLYADWSEVDQLKSLGKIVEDEKRSFIMQQNPENLINVGLYYEACDIIVQKILDKVNAEKNKEIS